MDREDLIDLSKLTSVRGMGPTVLLKLVPCFVHQVSPHLFGALLHRSVS